MEAALEAMGPERFYQELLGVAEMRGAKPEWASHRFKDKYGKYQPPEWKKLPAQEPSGTTMDWLETLPVYAKPQSGRQDDDVEF
jgi:hypothetical protein